MSSVNTNNTFGFDAASAVGDDTDACDVETADDVDVARGSAVDPVAPVPDAVTGFEPPPLHAARATPTNATTHTRRDHHTATPDPYATRGAPDRRGR